jgi:transposase
LPEESQWIGFHFGAKRRKETTMCNNNGIVLIVDYHAQNLEVRWFDRGSGEERRMNVPTTKDQIEQLLEKARAEAGGGSVRWIMESTTGWARVKDLVGDRAQFVLANVLQMPLPPKGHRCKTDKIDTERMLREELIGKLPRSFQPSRWWREVRRVVDCRLDLVRRTTALKNWISCFLHHETWEDRTGLWSGRGMRRLRSLPLGPVDRATLDWKLEELEQLNKRIGQVESQIRTFYGAWPMAEWVDEVYGIGTVTAVTLLAHIGPIKRFATAEELISYMGLAPSVRRSDNVGHNGRIGGGGTDSQMRYLLIESTTWLQKVPRYRDTYQRAVKNRGKRIARIVVARLFVRSLHKMLRENIRFNPAVPVVAKA